MIVGFVKRHPLAAFFSLAFLLSWLVGAPAAVFPEWPGLLTFLTVFGPAAAAFIVVGVVDGSEGVRRLLAPLGRWRVGIWWYLIVLLGPALTMFISMVAYGLLSGFSGVPGPLQLLPPVGSHLQALLLIFAYQFLILWGEEIGWRGYALPRLQARYHPLLASMILGVLWGLWHLPSFWIEGSVHQSMSLGFFVLASVGYSILYTWVYNGTRGSLLLVCLLHAANNTTVSYSMLFFKPLIEEPVFSLAVLAAFNILVMLLSGPKLLWRGASSAPQAAIAGVNTDSTEIS